MEIPGTVDIHNRAHPLGVFIKSHEDTLSCLDTLQALAAGVRQALLVQMPVCRFISDRAWAFLHSDKICLGEDDTPDVHGSCYAHFMRALDKASHVMESADSFPALQQDIRAVHDVTDDVVGKVSPNTIIVDYITRLRRHVFANLMVLYAETLASSMREVGKQRRGSHHRVHQLDVLRVLGELETVLRAPRHPSTQQWPGGS